MDETSAAIATLHRLRAMGVGLAIDDFGTGYSSLSYLRRLPASVVKIDRSFVMELGASSQGSTIVASVIHMAHALGMRIVAEGVETIEHVAALVTLGCDQMQGFYFAPPLTPEAATDYLRTYVAKPYAAS
jgi:EAL domain-containing protein (putative c-di-GMP-specific phosphodiesterase class I)